MIVIFDWDGTLCDSADHIVRAMKAAAVEIGIEEPEAAAVRNIIGLGLVDAFPHLRAFVVHLEGIANLLAIVHEVEDERVLLERMRAVEP